MAARTHPGAIAGARSGTCAQRSLNYRMGSRSNAITSSDEHYGIDSSVTVD